MIHKSIFKYMPTYADKFFKHFLLRGTPRNELNDPFEFVPTKDFYDWHNLTLESKGFQKNSYAECCKGWLPAFGVLSFSETKSNLLMWSHYAEYHKGIVIEFDSTNSFFADLKKVSYDNMKPNEIEELEDIFFIKSDEWIYEKEYRIIKDLKKHDNIFIRDTEKIKPKDGSVTYSLGKSPNLYMFAVPPESIVSVIFGCNSSKDFKDKIIQSISSNPLLANTSVYDATLSDTHFHLAFNKIVI